MKYESKIKIFNLPLICISLGEPAVGFIAIGQFAYGFITIAQFGVGLIFAFGQFTAGAYSIAQFSFGPVMSIGQFAFGWYSIGMLAVGYKGLHMIGWHFINNNFLGPLAADMEIIGYNLIYLVVLICLVIAFYTVFGFAAAAGVKATIRKISSKKENDDTGLFFNIEVITHTVFILLSFFLVAQFMNYTGLSSYLDKGNYRYLEKYGKTAEAEVLDVKYPGVTINDDGVVKIRVKVLPGDRETDPFTAVISTMNNKAGYLRIEQRIKVKYNPNNPKKVILVNE